MADLAILVPSRGRPQQLLELADAVAATARGTCVITAGVDDDDPAMQEYVAGASVDTYRVLVGPRRSLSGWTNLLAELALAANVEPVPRYFASLGDDHRPRTAGFDQKLIEEIEALPGGVGFAYGNDLLQGANMPTAWIASAQIVRALGWMMLPPCEHMYVDNAILELGRATGRIAYRPDVIIEHLHPIAHKADWDDSYRQSNAPDRYAADKAAFDAWRAGQLGADTAAVAALTA